MNLALVPGLFALIKSNYISICCEYQVFECHVFCHMLGHRDYVLMSEEY